MEIITLQEYTDQYVSLYEGEIRNLPNDLALRLINKGVAAQHDKDILNSTTTQDNGKVLTVVNGKPTFSTPAISEVNMNYSVFYANQKNGFNFLYKNSECSQYLLKSQAIEAFDTKDFIIVVNNDNKRYFIQDCYNATDFIRFSAIDSYVGSNLQRIFTIKEFDTYHANSGGK